MSGPAEINRRTCASCGHLCDSAAEFHPHLFCVLKKAGRKDPWADFKAANELLGVQLPVKPPKVSTLPRKFPATKGTK